MAPPVIVDFNHDVKLWAVYTPTGSIMPTYSTNLETMPIEWLSIPVFSNTYLTGTNIFELDHPATNAPKIFFRLRRTIPGIPEDMVLIPGGSFQMGDNFSEGSSRERPVHTVDVSAFYMDQYEVTKAKWDEVASWAANHGYQINPGGGSGKASNHPVHNVTWYECVKWCNARSEKEGLTPAYYTSSAKTTVYRTGEVNVANDWVRWDKGYRLPTEAEWEKAARGGLIGQRFPWGATINHDLANFRANGNAFAYDTSPYTTYTFHPDYDSGGFPYTSPVGSFSTNGYGLYDMAGNIWEWCWDWFSLSYYSASPTTDPRGPSSGSGRLGRGGSWYSGANDCRVANRLPTPGGSDGGVGFRAVLPADQ